MNENIECDRKFTPLVPVEIQQKLDEKKEQKLIPLRAVIRHGKFIVRFD
tara:strand:- start:726 stop:872 length:147 start_codon:yes stop_codon:yes gene_type:complete